MPSLIDTDVVNQKNTVTVILAVAVVVAHPSISAVIASDPSKQEYSVLYWCLGKWKNTIISLVLKSLFRVLNPSLKALHGRNFWQGRGEIFRSSYSVFGHRLKA